MRNLRLLEIVPESIASFEIVPLSKFHSRELFDCGSILLNQYLQKYALQSQKKNSARTFVVTSSKQSNVILGFYTLVIAEVQFVDLPLQYSKKYKPSMPRVNLARLGVDKQFQKQGLGGILLMHALKNIRVTAENVGIAACFVDAKDGIERFYLNHGFISMPSDSNRLFLPIKTIAFLLDE